MKKSAAKTTSSKSSSSTLASNEKMSASTSYNYYKSVLQMTMGATEQITTNNDTIQSDNDNNNNQESSSTTKQNDQYSSIDQFDYLFRESEKDSSQRGSRSNSQLSSSPSSNASNSSSSSYHDYDNGYKDALMPNQQQQQQHQQQRQQRQQLNDEKDTMLPTQTLAVESQSDAVVALSSALSAVSIEEGPPVAIVEKRNNNNDNKTQPFTQRHTQNDPTKSNTPELSSLSTTSTSEKSHILMHLPSQKPSRQKLVASKFPNWSFENKEDIDLYPSASDSIEPIITNINGPGKPPPPPLPPPHDRPNNGLFGSTHSAFMGNSTSAFQYVPNDKSNYPPKTTINNDSTSGNNNNNGDTNHNRKHSNPKGFDIYSTTSTPQLHDGPHIVIDTTDFGSSSSLGSRPSVIHDPLGTTTATPISYHPSVVSSHASLGETTKHSSKSGATNQSSESPFHESNDAFLEWKNRLHEVAQRHNQRAILYQKSLLAQTVPPPATQTNNNYDNASNKKNNLSNNIDNNNNSNNKNNKNNNNTFDNFHILWNETSLSDGTRGNGSSLDIIPFSTENNRSSLQRQLEDLKNMYQRERQEWKSQADISGIAQQSKSASGNVAIQTNDWKVQGNEKEANVPTPTSERVREITAIADTWKKRYEQLQQENERLLQEVSDQDDTANKEIAKLQTKLDEMEQKYQKSQQKLIDMQQNHRETIQQLQHSHDYALSRTVDASDRRYQAAQQQIVKLQETLRLELEESERKCQDLDRQQQFLDADLEKRTHEWQTERRRLEDEIKLLICENEELKTTLADKEVQWDADRNKLIEINHQYHDENQRLENSLACALDNIPEQTEMNDIGVQVDEIVAQDENPTDDPKTQNATTNKPEPRSNVVSPVMESWYINGLATWESQKHDQKEFVKTLEKSLLLFCNPHDEQDCESLSALLEVAHHTLANNIHILDSLFLKERNDAVNEKATLPHSKQNHANDKISWLHSEQTISSSISDQQPQRQGWNNNNNNNSKPESPIVDNVLSLMHNVAVESSFDESLVASPIDNQSDTESRESLQVDIDGVIMDLEQMKEEGASLLLEIDPNHHHGELVVMTNQSLVSCTIKDVVQPFKFDSTLCEADTMRHEQSPTAINSTFENKSGCGSPLMDCNVSLLRAITDLIVDGSSSSPSQSQKDHDAQVLQQLEELSETMHATSVCEDGSSPQSNNGTTRFQQQHDETNAWPNITSSSSIASYPQDEEGIEQQQDYIQYPARRLFSQAEQEQCNKYNDSPTSTSSRREGWHVEEIPDSCSCDDYGLDTAPTKSFVSFAQDDVQTPPGFNKSLLAEEYNQSPFLKPLESNLPNNDKDDDDDDGDKNDNDAINGWKKFAKQLEDRCEWLEQDRLLLAKISQDALQRQKETFDLELQNGMIHAKREAKQEFIQYQQQVQSHVKILVGKLCVNCQSFVR